MDKTVIRLEGDYSIVIADPEEPWGVTVYGCDCADGLNDLVKIAALRDALSRLLDEEMVRHG